MKAKQRIALFLAVVVVCGLLLVGGALAQGSTHYGLTWNVIAGGGGAMQSLHYALNGTVGQGMAGVITSASYRLGSGFWYGFGVSAAASYRSYLPLVLKQ